MTCEGLAYPILRWQARIMTTPGILRARDYLTTPWKNGGGVTREILAFPPGCDLDTFGWRISTAEVSRGGPFSVFPGVDRKLMVIQGRLRLSVGGERDSELSGDSSAASFSGDAATSAEPLAGPVIDLNVMTRRGQFTARVTRHEVNGSMIVQTASVTAVVVAVAPVVVSEEGTIHELSEWDALVLGMSREHRLSLRGQGAGLVLVEIASVEGLASH